MNKMLLVSLVLLGSCFHFTPAFPAPLADSRQMDSNSPRDATSTDYLTTVDEDKRTPFKFGTALGHKVKETEGDNFASDWWKAYNSLYNSNEKRGVRFGTALGHKSKNKDDNFNKDWLKKFKSLYPDADKRGVGYGTALGHGVGGNDDYADALEKMYQELYGKRSTLE